MKYWIWEIAGWFLVTLGVVIFYLCYLLLVGQHIVEAGILTFIGVLVFRGGIHLLKVAVAAQVCLQAQERLSTERPAVPRPPASGRRPETTFRIPKT